MTDYTVDSLRAGLRQSFKAQYALNDEAHREVHFEEVFQTGVHINRTLDCGFDERLILLAAYTHDLFAWSRKNHHQLSNVFVKTTDHPTLAWLSRAERAMVAEACLTHRASYKGVFLGGFEELFNAADRGFPRGVKSLVDRAILYRQSLGFKGTHEELVADALVHIQEKYGTRGYASFPVMYYNCFEDELIKQRQQVDEAMVVDFL